MKYQHFTIEEREKIQELLWQKTSIRSISRALGRDPSSVSREVQRNKPPEQNRYTPRMAHERALAYRKRRGKRRLEMNSALREYTVSHLKLGWSPEQIAATTPEAIGESISHEAVYQYIYAQIHQHGYGYVKPGREDLRPYLARRRKRRMKKGLRKSYRIDKGQLPSIDLLICARKQLKNVPQSVIGKMTRSCTPQRVRCVYAPQMNEEAAWCSLPKLMTAP